MMWSSIEFGFVLLDAGERVLVLEQRHEPAVEPGQDPDTGLLAQRVGRGLVGQADRLVRGRQDLDRGVELDVETVGEHVELQLADRGQDR